MADSPQQFTPTPTEIVAFLESVRDEVHHAAEAKRNQFSEKYSNATIESMLRGIKWADARERIALPHDLPAYEVEQVTNVIRRELTVGTVEQIDGLLTQTVLCLREALELEFLPRELANERGIPASVLIATGPPYDRNTCEAAATLHLNTRNQPSFCAPLDWDNVDVETLKLAITKRRERGEPAEGLNRELDELCKHFPNAPKPVSGWEGPIPSEPIDDLYSLVDWLGASLENVLCLRDIPSLFRPAAALDLGKQTLRNARRLLDQIGAAGFPDCDTESLQSVHAAEQALANLRRWLRGKIDSEEPTPTSFVTSNPHALAAVGGGSLKSSWENPEESESPFASAASPGEPLRAASAQIEPNTHNKSMGIDCGEGNQAIGTASESQSGFLGGEALANALGIHPTRKGAFFRKLERQRMSIGDDSWHEVRDPRPNSPRFLYRADSIKLRVIAAAYKSPKPA